MTETLLSNLFFDWYGASVPRSRNWLDQVVKMAFPHGVWEICRAKNGYSHGEQLLNPDGSVLFTVYYGGAAQGGNLYCFATGAAAESFSQFIRSVCPDHELVRADVALDFDEPYAWLTLFDLGMRAGSELKLMTSYQGPSEQERASVTDKGRTLYIGSRQSVGMFRLYEKGKKECKDRPDWVRLEFEFKPKNKGARFHYAKASHLDIMQATKAARFFCEAFGHVVHMASVPPGTIRVDTDFDRAYKTCKDQYHKTLMHMLEHKFHGDLHAMTLDLLKLA